MQSTYQNVRVPLTKNTDGKLVKMVWALDKETFRRPLSHLYHHGHHLKQVKKGISKITCKFYAQFDTRYCLSKINKKIDRKTILHMPTRKL